MFLGDQVEQQAEITASINRMNSFHRQVNAIVNLASAVMSQRHDERALHSMREAVREWGRGLARTHTVQVNSDPDGYRVRMCGSVLIDVGVGVDVGRLVSPKAAPVGGKQNTLPIQSYVQDSKIVVFCGWKIMGGESRVEI